LPHQLWIARRDGGDVVADDYSSGVVQVPRHQLLKQSCSVVGLYVSQDVDQQDGVDAAVHSPPAFNRRIIDGCFHARKSAVQDAGPQSRDRLRSGSTAVKDRRLGSRRRANSISRSPLPVPKATHDSTWPKSTLPATSSSALRNTTA